jgi:hypothetical protein
MRSPPALLALLSFLVLLLAHTASPLPAPAAAGFTVNNHKMKFLTPSESAHPLLTSEEFEAIFHNAEAHQHPWLATTISVAILMMLIIGVMCIAEMGGGGADVRRLQEVLGGEGGGQGGGLRGWPGAGKYATD